MVVVSLELNNDDISGKNEPITAFELLQRSQNFRQRLRKIAESMQVLEDMGENFRLNEFSVDCELRFDTIKETKEYLDKLGLDINEFDFTEVIEEV